MEKLSYDYMEMFRGILSDFPGQLEHLRREVKWAKTLRKQDRIVWFLRWLRIAVYDGIALTLHGDSDPARRELSSKYARLMAAEMQRIGWSDRDMLYISLHSAKDSIVHFLGIPSPAIQNLVWGRQTPAQLLGSFEEAENDWKGADSDRALAPHEDDQVALRFPNGWAWWLLGRGYCPEEAKAMGHCGNVAGRDLPGQRILSLRRPVKGPGGREAWEPHLTFILHIAHKALGEMKGRGNEKPAARYHPYIAALLESPVVEEIWGGGYLPENNFSMADLPRDVQEGLVQKKPALMTFRMRLAKEGAQGPSEELVRDITWKLSMGADDWSPRLRAFRIGTWKSAIDFAGQFGTEETRQVIQLALDGEGIPTSSDMGEDEYVLEALRALSPDNLKRVVDYTRWTDPKALEWWAKNRGNPDTPEGIAQMIGRMDLPNIRTNLYSCWYRGMKNGTVFQLLHACCNEIEKLNPVTPASTELAWGDPSPRAVQTYTRSPDRLLLATPLWETVPLEFAAAVADDEEKDPREMPYRYEEWSGLELKAPPDGWGDFSKRTVNEEARFFFHTGDGIPEQLASLDIAKVAYDYMEMFRGFLADFPRFQPTVTNTISWCKRVLRKRDRITWWLRQMRLFWYNLVADKASAWRYAPATNWPATEVPADNTAMIALADKYQALFDREVRSLGPLGLADRSNYLDLGMFANSNQSTMEHLLSLPVPEIQNLVWERQTKQELFRTLLNYETKWKEESKGVLRPRPGDRPVITFGDGWAWWLLDRGYCEEEARAMGHCGNVNGQNRPYERILSLRKSVRRGGTEYYEPHLTFILDTRDSSLGEMKGKGNNKPAPQYHPYILRLLESDIVSKVKGGGYLPEHNFRLGDLSEEQREELAQRKPSMAAFYIRLKREGPSPALIADIGSALQVGGWDPDLQGYVIRQWENMSSLAEDIGNDTAKWIAKVVGGGEFNRHDSPDFEYGDRSEAMKMALGACSDKTLDLVVRCLAYKYPTNLVEWLEHNNTDYSGQATGFMERGFGDSQARKWLSKLNLKIDGVLGDDDDIIDFIEFASLDDEESTLLNAWTDATQSGTEIDMNRDFEHAANDLLGTEFPWGTMLRRKGKYFWDDPIYEFMPLAKAIEVADSGEDSASSYMEANGRDDSEEFRLKVDEPYYGYNGWDESAADERISEGFSFKEEPEPEPPKKARRPRKPRAPKPKKVMSALGDIAGKSALGGMKLAYDYMEMFRGLLQDFPGRKETIDGEIAWCKRVLKKRDRITWWLRWFRLFEYHGIRHNPMYYWSKYSTTEVEEQLPQNITPAIRERLAALSRKYDKAYTDEMHRLGWTDFRGGHYPDSTRHTVEHYLSLPVPEIQGLVWERQQPYELFMLLMGLEEKWKERTKGVVAPHEGDKPVLTFGGGWAWWLLDRGYCEDEARAMGHCGNVAGQYDDDQRILSLRQSVRRGSEEFYEPHLTFILHTGDNSLGEMKGKGNAKPTARYHPYIVKLLESGLVDRVRGGGYLPEHNFSMTDLPQAEQDRLVALKPSLMSFAYRLGKEGITKGLLSDLSRVLSPMEEGKPYPVKDWYMPKRRGFLINSYTLKEFTEEFGDEESQDAADVLEGRTAISTGIGGGEGYWAGWGGTGGVDPLEDTLSAIGMTTLMMAEKYYRGLSKELLPDTHLVCTYDQARRTSTGPVAGILSFISQNRLLAESNSITEAWKRGRNAGIKASMLKELDSALDSILDRRLEDGTIFYRLDPARWNSDIEHILPLEEAVAIADQGQTFEDFFEGWDQSVWTPVIEFEVPPQGWPGWDAQAAELALREHYSSGQEEEGKKPKPRGRRKAR